MRGGRTSSSTSLDSSKRQIVYPSGMEELPARPSSTIPSVCLRMKILALPYEYPQYKLFLNRMTQWKVDVWVQITVEEIITELRIIHDNNIARKHMGGRDTRAYNAIEMNEEEWGGRRDRAEWEGSRSRESSVASERSERARSSTPRPSRQ